MVIVAVALRYVFNNPLTWGEELIVALLTWMVFIGAASATRSQMHIRIDALAPVFRMRQFSWLNVVTVLIGLVIIVVMLFGCYEQVLQELVVDSPMMGVSQGLVRRRHAGRDPADADPHSARVDGQGRCAGLPRRDRGTRREGRGVL